MEISHLNIWIFLKKSSIPGIKRIVISENPSNLAGIVRAFGTAGAERCPRCAWFYNKVGNPRARQAINQIILISSIDKREIYYVCIRESDAGNCVFLGAMGILRL